jgi:energy-coupling factor transporter ATP-binding protein EcfA2
MNANEQISSSLETGLPSSPYPGLRPFLANEAALLFGRERQVQEIIKRLDTTQFVAVIGGSGCGKSSLIYAGVVPSLRSYGIPGAGDFWISMICTPGTNTTHATGANNVAAPDNGDVAASARPSPVTRFARKFEALLRPAASPAEAAARLADIEQIFRQDAGFSRLTDVFRDDLLLPAGPKVEDARLLFVIDQFEEIFHPTNAHVDDCRVMVQRIIDHFFRPHKHCYVALTMRSEHLNDCATYLGLPEAINKAIYLVPRLNPDQLRQAMIAPALRFLRLRKREADDESLPDSVEFEPRVSERLLTDTLAISEDPDHLPLFQHALARTWEAACARQTSKGEATRVPATIVWADLEVAVSGADSRATDALGSNCNALRSSLEHWATRLYERYSAHDRSLLDGLLRRLAFKDPNTGTYTQQRVAITELALPPGNPGDADRLVELIDRGFVRSAHYMFWDTGSAQHVTLKVSHESFIRGWSHFRLLIDKEADRFEEFVAVLRRCGSWLTNGKTPDRLLDDADLRRLREQGMEEMFVGGEQRQAWLWMLQLDRDGARLADFAPTLDEFLKASADKQSAEFKSRALNRTILWAAVGLALVFLPLVLFSMLVQAPVLRSVARLSDANTIVASLPVIKAYPSIGDPVAITTSRSLQAAATKVDEVRSDEERMVNLGPDDISRHIDWLPPIKEQRGVLLRIASIVEPQINGRIRSFLSTTMWKTGNPPDLTGVVVTASTSVKSCDDAQDGARKTVKGQVFWTAGSDASITRPALFVPDYKEDVGLVVRAANIDAEGRCTFSQPVFSAPAYVNPFVVFDATLRYLLASTGELPDQRTVLFEELVWGRDSQSGRWVTRQPSDYTVVTDTRSAEAVSKEAGSLHAKSVTTWLTRGGVAFSVDGNSWRVAAGTQAAPLMGSEGLNPLARSNNTSECMKLKNPESATFANVRPEVPLMFEDAKGRYCFEITPYQAGTGAAGNTSTQRDLPAGSDTQWQDVTIAIYDKPNGERLNSEGAPGVLPIARLPPFGVVGGANNNWYVGESGPYDGWIAIRANSGGAERYLGVPWSTHALSKLIDDVVAGK